MLCYVAVYDIKHNTEVKCRINCYKKLVSRHHYSAVLRHKFLANQPLIDGSFICMHGDGIRLVFIVLRSHVSVPDTDFETRGWGRSSRSWDKGALRASVCSKNQGEASPRSATKYGFSEEKKTISLSQCSPWPTKVVQYFGLIVLNIELMFESFWDYSIKLFLITYRG